MPCTILEASRSCPRKPSVCVESHQGRTCAAAVHNSSRQQESYHVDSNHTTFPPNHRHSTVLTSTVCTMEGNALEATQRVLLPRGTAARVGAGKYHSITQQNEKKIVSRTEKRGQAVSRESTSTSSLPSDRVAELPPTGTTCAGTLIFRGAAKKGSSEALPVSMCGRRPYSRSIGTAATLALAVREARAKANRKRIA